MRRYLTWPRVLIALLVAVIAIYLMRHLVWETSTERSGYSAVARHNSYLAGMRLLQQLGYSAQPFDDNSSLSTLPADATLLLEDSVVMNDPTRRQAVLAWVRRGGHLVLPLGSGSAAYSLDDALGIVRRGILEPRQTPTPFIIEGKLVIAQLGSAAVFDLRQSPQWSAILTGRFGNDKDMFGVKQGAENRRTKKPTKNRTNDEQHAKTSLLFHVYPRESADTGPLDHVMVYARFAFGAGVVTVGDFAPFTNSSLPDRDHAELFVRLMTLPDGKGPCYFALTPVYPSLFAWLFAHATMVLISAACLLIALIWFVAPRFGPLIPVSPPIRPGLREHLVAVGDFLLREKQFDALITPLRDQVKRGLHHLRHRHPELAAPHELGARLSNIDANDIAHALTSTPRSAHEFLRSCRTLISLNSCISQMQYPSSFTGNRS
ncbi:MAG TPA: DUF4350 domain-containing protein [Rhodocyclaceae bacterium]|nr:DUF4350 domain-containing protein [Rhodocyclaceae bacterium]